MAITVSLVGSATVTGATGIGTVTGSVTAGSLLVTIFTTESSSGSHAVTDNQNAGAYAADFLSQVAFRSTSVGTASKTNTFTGSLTVTLTVGANQTGKMAVYELTGCGGFDSGNANDGDGSTSTDGGVGPAVSNTPTFNNCAAFGMFVSGAGNATGTDAGYTAAWTAVGLNNNYHAGEYIADAGTGAETITHGVTAASNSNWHLGLAMYKPASSARPHGMSLLGVG